MDENDVNMNVGSRSTISGDLGKAQRENRAKESHVEAAEGDDEETVSQQNVSEDESNESNNEMETDEDEAFEEESEESAFESGKSRALQV